MKQPIWKPLAERQQNANITQFIDLVNKRYGQNNHSFDELYNWSIKSPADFWSSVWDFCEIKSSKPYDKVLTNPDDMLDCKWFPGARLNFAENMLRYRDERTAFIFKGEAQEPVRMTYAELYEQVARLAKSLREAKLTFGDRVGAFMPNMMETIIARLATASIGAIWSSTSPDFGVKGVLDRFGQIEPKILFTANGYSYNGKSFDSLERITTIVRELPSVKKVIVVPYTEKNPVISHIPNSVLYQDFLSQESGLGIKFEQLPFDHPLDILYSSGTTGIPKCIVHGAGRTMIEHFKELKLHTDLKRKDTIFYFTTCGWMMWNWLASSLAMGATLVLFDGLPFYPDNGTLFKLAQDEKITIFGASAKYFSEIERRDIKPGAEYDLSHLKTILSTGSPLSKESFEFIYRDIKKDLLLGSIAGGTDIDGCFFISNPISPVYAGELQSRGLGIKVEVFNPAGKSVINQKGELVVTRPFPCMPIYFWNDHDLTKYKSAYFDVYPGVWTHGDYTEITDTGGAIIYGRSDATLNPGGVRIGSADIYRQIETIEGITDSVVVGQDWENDIRIILFIKLAPGVELDENLINRIKTTIRQNTTPRHVPAKIIPVADIPYTINMKKVEIAVRKVIHNQLVLNADALANPESLELYKNIKELQS